MNHRARNLLAVALASAALFTAGCGDGTAARCAVGGTVTFKGVPLDYGTIAFENTSGGVATGTGGALIRNGSYAIAAAPGLEPGTYRVRISSPEESTVSDEDYAQGKMPLSNPERIPAEYNTESKLSVEVSAGGANRFDFKL